MTFDLVFFPTGYTKEDILTLGITNQRETTIAWDKFTGEPLHPAICECTGVFTKMFNYLKIYTSSITGSCPQNNVKFE